MFRSSLLILSIVWFVQARAQTEQTPVTVESINRSPVFSVLQNSTSLSEFYTKPLSDQPGVTDLCIPASMAELLMVEAQQNSQLAQYLQFLPGPVVTEESSSKVVKRLITDCAFEPRTFNFPKGSVNWRDGAACLQKILSATSHDPFKTTYIRPDFGPPTAILAWQGIEIRSRAPTLSDLTEALRRQAYVIGILSFQKWDETSRSWSISSSHSINIFGFAREEGASSNEILGFIQNSNRNYNKNGKDPVFDIAMLQSKTGLADLVRTSPIELTTRKGRLINFPGVRTFLAGLVIVERSL